MKIYTRTGDKGQTSLVYGTRVLKTDLRVEAYGTCDEANSMIGLALSHIHDLDFEGKDKLQQVFHVIQTDLFHVGAELATPEGKKVGWVLNKESITDMELYIDELNEELPPFKNFILPGGHPAGATLHVARTIVRRAERKAIAIGEGVNPLVIAYLNRLSDLLFVAARFLNLRLGRLEPTLHE